MSKIKVMVVDDSVVIREMLAEIIKNSDTLELVASCSDPIDAQEKLKKVTPDVITLDVVMPHMDGITFLKKLMKVQAIPTIMFSSLTSKGASETIEALESGAVDYIHKPKDASVKYLNQYEKDVVEKIEAASKAKVQIVKPSMIKKYANASNTVNNKSLVVIGSSTGGIEALSIIMQSLPSGGPPIVIVQHLPSSFTDSVVSKMNSHSEVSVVIAKDGQLLEQGKVYFAPGDKHIKIGKDLSGYQINITDDEEVNRHKPSVDYLFLSIAKAKIKDACGVLLTGMGRDGARGLLEMNKIGCHTIAQDEDSSTIWGMPGAAVKLGAATEVLNITDITGSILERTRN